MCNMEDSKRSLSLKEVKVYLDSIPDSVDFRFGHAYRDCDGSICCEMNFVDDEEKVKTYENRLKCHRRITDSIALVIFSVLLFIVGISCKDQHTLFIYVPWIAVFMLLLALYGFISVYKRMAQQGSDYKR